MSLYHVIRLLYASGLVASLGKNNNNMIIRRCNGQMKVTQKQTPQRIEFELVIFFFLNQDNKITFIHFFELNSYTKVKQHKLVRTKLLVSRDFQNSNPIRLLLFNIK